MNSVYYKELSQLQTLPREEQLALALKAQAGDAVAKEKLIKSHLKLVVHYAKGLENYLAADGALTVDDLICEGNIALIEAIGSYNPNSGSTISYYAGIVVKRRIISYIMQNNSSIRVPERKMKELLKLIKKPNPAEDNFKDAGKINYSIPLKVQLPDFFEYSNENDGASHLEQWEEIEVALNKLNPREKEIVRLYYGFNNKPRKTQEQIGKDIGLSKARINQILNRVISKLKPI